MHISIALYCHIKILELCSKIQDNEALIETTRSNNDMCCQKTNAIHQQKQPHPQTRFLFLIVPVKIAHWWNITLVKIKRPARLHFCNKVHELSGHAKRLLKYNITRTDRNLLLFNRHIYTNKFFSVVITLAIVKKNYQHRTIHSIWQ